MPLTGSKLFANMAWSQTDTALPLHARLLIALLRLTLGDGRKSEELTYRHTDETWSECRRLAVAQGVHALAWDGVLQLPAELRPPREIFIAWGVAVAQYEKRYEYYCRTAQKFSDFLVSHGIGMLQFKGIGLSSYYPVPSHREGGDIDMTTYSLDRASMDDSDANRLTDDLMRSLGAKVDTESTVKHSSFDFDGVHFENHKTFLNLAIFKSERVAEDYLHRHSQPHETPLCGGRYHISSTGIDFYNVFLPLHFCHHYRAGHNLHQVCDWAVMLCRGCGHLPDEITYPGIRQAYASLNALTMHLFGDIAADKARIDLTSDTEMAEDMLLSAISTDHKHIGNHPPKSMPDILWFKTRRMIYRTKMQKRIFGVSMTKTIISSVFAHILRPSSIFLI